MTVFRAYWWRGKDPHNSPVLNWGDRMVGVLPYWLGCEFAWRPVEQAELVILGSVLEHLPPGWSGTVCGAGKLHRHSHVDLSKAKVLALRGRLTADSVHGLSRRSVVVLGDPGLIVPHYVPQTVAKYDLGVLPHWSDTELAKRFCYGHVINPTDHPDKVIREIGACKRLITSSLHGAIVADAYGIPRQSELFPLAAREGGDFKYHDYASIYDGDPHFGEMWQAPHEVVERVQNELAVVLADATGTAPPPAPVPAAPPDVRHREETGPQISILVPFRHDKADAEHRGRIWDWLQRFWREHLPSAEIIIGNDSRWPFSKSSAVNNAASRARGRVFVILDADAFINPAVIQRAADRIDEALAAGRRMWLIPYRRLYRLNRQTTNRLLASDPTAFYAVPSPPPSEWCEANVSGDSSNYGYLYGAMIQIMPKEGFFAAGGMDERMRGWGGEDVSLLKSVDTLYCQHEVMNHDVLHMHHERPGTNWRTRRWMGQFGQANSRLSQRYHLANGEAAFMRGLANEHVQPRPLD